MPSFQVERRTADDDRETERREAIRRVGLAEGSGETTEPIPWP